LAYYQLELRPWLAFARLRENSFLFHGKTLYDQTRQILANYPNSDWDWRATGDDPAYTDAVQFNESDHNYLHRRWEERGFFYWYEHRADGHQLVLANDSLSHCKPIDIAGDPRLGNKPTLPWQAEAGAREDDGIYRFSPRRTAVASSVASTSFDFKRPQRPEQATLPTLNPQGDKVPRLERYGWTGAYASSSFLEAEALVKRRIQAVEAGAKTFEAQSNARRVQPGRSFFLINHFEFGTQGRPEPEGEFLILSAQHRARNNYAELGQNQDPETEYQNSFSCIRKKIPWRAPQGHHSEQPRIYGLQTAVVVGPAGQEIHTDRYGRIRVQFHWDREGAFDEQSSAWVRVATPSAGSNFGAVSIPRIGQEVLVQFLDGNPDRPLVTGSVYNELNMPPWSLPANKTQSGILSRSTQGGRYDNANAIRFEDQKGQEELWLHAEKDQRIEVENDESHWVGRDRTKTIDRHETVQVKGNRTETVDLNETITVHQNRSETVDQDESITIHQNRKERVDLNETISIGANRSEDVGGNETVKISGNRNVTVSGAKTETVSMAKAETIGLAKALTVGLAYQTSVGAMMNTTVALSQSAQIGMSKSTDVGKTYSITAGDELSITVGKASLVMKADGTITINGHTFSLGTSGEQKFNANGEITVKGQQIKEN
jgi:type VI secretion system secreted protein VgrG